MVVDRAIALRGSAVVVVDRQNCESWSWIVVVNADFVDRGRGSWSLRPRIASKELSVMPELQSGSWIVVAIVIVVVDRGRGSWIVDRRH